jgi:hypothetical protein
LDAGTGLEAMKIAFEAKSGSGFISSSSRSNALQQVEKLKEIVKEMNGIMLEEKRVELRRRKEESKHFLTANEAASRFQFRKASGGLQLKKGSSAAYDTKLKKEKQIVLENQKKFDEIFGAK